MDTQTQPVPPQGQRGVQAPGEIWDRIQKDFQAGLSAPACARRYGVGVSTIHRIKVVQAVNQRLSPADTAADTLTQVLANVMAKSGPPSDADLDAILEPLGALDMDDWDQD